MRANAPDALTSPTGPRDGHQFQSVLEAVNYAFAMHAKQIGCNLTAEPSIRGTNPADLTTMDKIADGCMIRAAILDAQGVSPERAAILARHTIPSDDVATAQKERAITDLRAWAYARKTGADTRRDVWACAEDTIRQWVGDRPQHPLLWWSRRLKTPYATLYRWMRSDSPEDRSIQWLCGLWLESAYRQAGVALYARGIIGP